MPYFAIQTNQELNETERADLLQSASAFVAEMLGKSEAYVMVAIDAGAALSFGGSRAPSALVTLRSIGLPVEQCTEYAARISQFLETSLHLPRDRVFIDFADLQRDRFAWNGKTFA
ncbi:MAG: phenylpyruvate tautomerase MIF-related protein [Desulfosarcinaceae bacterium]|nr:phenylpyruvate tautomerase MIF-related protein [Desulfosarcinaceae bacterium]